MCDFFFLLKKVYNISLRITRNFNLSYDIERILLGDGTWSAGLCSERGERKPPCARNHPRYDRWFRQIHQVTKRVGIQLSNHSESGNFISSDVLKFEWNQNCKSTNSWYWSGDCYIRVESCENYLLASEKNFLLTVFLVKWHLFDAFNFSYRDKAMKDTAVVSKHVETLLQSVGKVFT